MMSSLQIAHFLIAPGSILARSVIPVRNWREKATAAEAGVSGRPNIKVSICRLGHRTTIHIPSLLCPTSLTQLQICEVVLLLIALLQHQQTLHLFLVPGPSPFDNYRAADGGEAEK